MATKCKSPTGQLNLYRKFSFTRFLIFGWWLGPIGTFTAFPTLISLSIFLDKVGIDISPWGVTQWCWGNYWVPEWEQHKEDLDVQNSIVDKEETPTSVKETTSEKTPESPEDRLQKLADMKEKGLINEDEFNSKKEDILKEM